LAVLIIVRKELEIQFTKFVNRLDRLMSSIGTQMELNRVQVWEANESCVSINVGRGFRSEGLCFVGTILLVRKVPA